MRMKPLFRSSKRRRNRSTPISTKQIAESIANIFSSDYLEKRNNPRFKNEKEFISQIAAEIGSQKDQLKRADENIHWQDKPKPRVYFYDSSYEQKEFKKFESEQEVQATSDFSEHDLYPLLIEYLNSEHKLYCLRIDEKRSKNSRGSGGNQWLHPDIVAMQTVDKEWHELVRSCIQQGAGQAVRLWSFEVKKELSVSNVRKSFFQAVSNSSWANEGYLVATSISDSNVEHELRMLSALHGIGVILLDSENPSESEIMLPAKARPEIDWQSVNRILSENSDFKDYIELVSTYYQTGRVRIRDWNK